MDAQMQQLQDFLNSLPPARPLAWNPRTRHVAVVEYAKRDPARTIRPFVEDTGIHCGNWALECYESSRRFGKTGPTWTGD